MKQNKSSVKLHICPCCNTGFQLAKESEHLYEFVKHEIKNKGCVGTVTSSFIKDYKSICSAISKYKNYTYTGDFVIGKRYLVCPFCKEEIFINDYEIIDAILYNSKEFQKYEIDNDDVKEFISYSLLATDNNYKFYIAEIPDIFIQIYNNEHNLN